MMDDQVLLPDRRENVAAMIANALGMARDVRHEFEIGPVEPRQLRQLVHGEHAIDQQHLVVGGGERALHERAQFLRHRRLDLQPDHRSAAPAFQRGLEQTNQIFRLFLDFQFGVPDDAERALPLHGIAGKQPADEQAGGLFQRDQPHRAVLACGQADETVDPAGHADQRIHRLAVGNARQMQRHGKAEAGDERERMRRIDRQRRQQRENIVEEMILDPCPLGFGHVAAIDQNDSDLGENAAQIAPDRLLIGGELRDRFIDEDKLLRRCVAVRAALGDALAHLRLDAGHADHEELIKVIGGNRQESHPLQRRVARIDRFLEHPAIEMEPGQLAVDETFRTCSDRGTRMRFRFFFF